MVRPTVDDVRAPESALAGYLESARTLLEQAPEWVDHGDQRGALSPEFEHLRWFDLPAASLAR
jgi:hypothetical protein